jgi:hypothetical protein
MSDLAANIKPQGIVFQSVPASETLAERVRRILDNGGGQCKLRVLKYNHHVSEIEIDSLVRSGKFAVVEIRQFKRAGRPSRILVAS